MCEVYEFPVKKQLPEELKEGLQKLAKDYVQLMDESLKTLDVDNPTEEEINDFMEEIILIYTDAIMKAVDEIL